VSRFRLSAGATLQRISISLILVLFGSTAFVAGAAYQIHVYKQMPTVIIKPQLAPEQPAAPKRRTVI
jgi:hypothetical protein